MRFKVIACDYDSTLAHDGQVPPKTLQVLRRARRTGEKLILITGRTLDDLQAVFSELPVFDIIVAENGAVMLSPEAGSEETLSPAPPAKLVSALSKRRVPFSLGRCVLATHRPYETVVQQVIGDLNLDLAIIFNRESVMVLPRGIDKASGLAAALSKLRIPPSRVVGIGDAENDVSFLRMCGFSVAVANAIDSLKRQVDYVTTAKDGAGVAEVVEQVIAGRPLVGAPD